MGMQIFFFPKISLKSIFTKVSFNTKPHQIKTSQAGETRGGVWEAQWAKGHTDVPQLFFILIRISLFFKDLKDKRRKQIEAFPHLKWS